ncbi:MAG: hypothetical protein ACK4WF_06135 [Candidatus Brocadiales bacterium]
MRPWHIGAAGLFLAAAVSVLFIVALGDLGAGELRHKYYLLAETGHEPGCVVDVHINDEHVVTVEPEVKKEIIEVTSYVEAGDNEVVFEVEALTDEGDDNGTIDIQIGSGTYKDGKLSWEALSVQYSVSRSQLKKEEKDIITTSLKFNAS